MTQREWRHKVLPECRGKAQEVVAQLRALGIRIELTRGDWLVIDLDGLWIDQRAVEILERVWPQWRDCVSE